MYAKEWIYIFDDGTPYWHELLDKGRVALREHIKGSMLIRVGNGSSYLH